MGSHGLRGARASRVAEAVGEDSSTHYSDSECREGDSMTPLYRECRPYNRRPLIATHLPEWIASLAWVVFTQDALMRGVIEMLTQGAL